MGRALQRCAAFRSTRTILALMVCLTMLPATLAFADDLQSLAQHLSDSAFAILNSITSDSSKSAASDVMGAIASFAGDAQTLAAALASGDRAGASSAMAALISDRRAVDDALGKNPRAIDSSKWSPLKAELASIQDRVPHVSSAAKEAPYPEDVVKPPVGEVTANIPEGSAPQVQITSRESDESGLHLKGFIEGDDLKSAGIYDGEAMIQKIDLAPTTGQQRVLLDFTLEQVSRDETIRVADSAGRTAEARVASNTTSTVESGGHEKMIELGGGAAPSEEPPVDLASRPPDNTAEIPSKSPSRRHMHENATLAPLDAQINILGVQQNLSSPNNYGITGQISGEGVSHAGIYVDGRMVKPIPIADGETSFNVSFTMLGKEATIRAYGNGSNFVESTLDLSNANGAVYGANPPMVTYGYPVSPYARSPYGYPPNPYAASPYGPAPYGYPNNGYLNGYGYQPPPRRPWWQKIF